MSIPRATYRLQLHQGFGFKDAAAIVPYLSALGVSHVYCSPYLRARRGSKHGYDIINHHELNPEIGTRAEFDAFVAALREHGMGQVMDVVPNHMGVMAADNLWWMDVLENGEASAYAEFFDIDWHPASAHLANRLLVPVLGGHYGAVLETGEIALAFDPARGTFSVNYHQHRFPLDPRTYPRVLDGAGADLGDLPDRFRSLPRREVAATKHERIAAAANLKHELALACADPKVAAAIERAVRSCNGTPGDASSFDALHGLLEGQAYRLAYWQVASDEINYRRFFDVNELAALRMERAEVFDATHQLVFELVGQGAVDGLRIDHPDGLYDPAGYFRRLQEKYVQVRGGRDAIEPRRPLYVVVEKIVASFESIPEGWAVHGTTGYRFANLVNGLYVDESASRAFTRLYSGYSGVADSFEDIALRSRLLVLRTALASELTVLANRLARLAHAQRATRDYTLNTLRHALAEVIASFPVYRTYIAENVSADDRRWVEWAAARAKRHHTRATDAGIFDFICATLLSEAQPMRDFAMKFQQLTAPVMAKGVEDTSFYIYNRLVSLNDVGSDPAAFGYGVNAFHGASADRAAKWPQTMLATSTHDNKRSEDVRARINVLSELPAAWRLNLRRWSRMNRSKKRLVDGVQAPCRNDEYLLYQTLLGSLPFSATKGQLGDYAKRIESYMLKAAREAKVHTSWINPNHEYEAAVSGFVHGLLAPGRNIFLERLRTAAETVSWLGMLNSLSMTAIKLTSPGVPDIYQGTEVWDFSLVDPDNRRPVDYAARSALLDALPQAEDLAGISTLFRSAHDGRAKLLVIARLLAFRREHPGLFQRAGYLPLQVSGTRQSNVVAFARTDGKRGLITVATRLHASLGVGAGELPCGEAVWGDTGIDLSFLPEATQLRHLVTGARHGLHGGRLRLAEILAEVPVGVLAYQ